MKGKIKRQSSAHRIAHDMTLEDIQLVQQADDIGSDLFHLIHTGSGRFCAGAVTRKIDGNHLIIALKSGTKIVPGGFVAAKAMQKQNRLTIARDQRLIMMTIGHQPPTIHQSYSAGGGAESSPMPFAESR